MPSLPIVIGADNPVLRAPTRKIPKVTKEIQKLIKDMETTIRAADGLGLAAPQVGESVRLCLVRIGTRLVPLINPEIIRRSDETETAEEGCLSLPNIWLEITRPKSIVIRYQDVKGQEQERLLEHVDARIVQHEVDHLDGRLIVDYPIRSKAL